jgi:hypothetical protein
VTCCTMQKSYFHRAVPKRAEESRRELTKAEESRSERSQQKGGMFILRCSATVGYTRYAISTTIERTFSGGCTIEATSWLYKRSCQQSLMSRFGEFAAESDLGESFTSQFLRSSSTREFLRSSPTSEVSIGDRHGKCEDVKCVII